MTWNEGNSLFLLTSHWEKDTHKTGACGKSFLNSWKNSIKLLQWKNIIFSLNTQPQAEFEIQHHVPAAVDHLSVSSLLSLNPFLSVIDFKNYIKNFTIEKDKFLMHFIQAWWSLKLHIVSFVVSWILPDITQVHLWLLFRTLQYNQSTQSSCLCHWA